MTLREFWMIVHGMGFGSVFLLAFTVTLVGLYSLRNDLVTVEGIRFWSGKIKVGLWVMAVIAWGTVITGTYIIFPWYRAVPPAGTLDLSDFPRYFLLAEPTLVQWQNIGMEWKEIVGWVTPIAATVVAYVFQVYGTTLMSNRKVRSALLEFFAVAFLTAGIAGVFGAFITKIVPLH
jgi:hypothetical protein